MLICPAAELTMSLGMTNGLTRGGPLAQFPRSQSVSGGLGSDSRKPLSLRAGGFYNWNEVGGWGYGTFGSVDLRPTPSVTMSVMMNPGATALTVILREPSSFASDLVKPINPAFEDA